MIRSMQNTLKKCKSAIFGPLAFHAIPYFWIHSAYILYIQILHCNCEFCLFCALKCADYAAIFHIFKAFDSSLITHFQCCYCIINALLCCNYIKWIQMEIGMYLKTKNIVLHNLRCKLFNLSVSDKKHDKKNHLRQHINGREKGKNVALMMLSPLLLVLSLIRSISRTLWIMAGHFFTFFPSVSQ